MKLFRPFNLDSFLGEATIHKYGSVIGFQTIPFSVSCAHTHTHTQIQTNFNKTTKTDKLMHYTDFSMQNVKQVSVQ